MARLTKYSASLYLTLFTLGSLWLFAAAAGALGRSLDWLGAIAGLCFVGVAIYGMQRRQNFKRLPGAIKALLGAGITTVAIFAVLMIARVLASQGFN